MSRHSASGGLAPGTGPLVLIPIGVAVARFVPEAWGIRFGTTLRWTVAYAVGFVSAHIFMSGGSSPFIYYQF